MSTVIKSVSSYIPENKITSESIENKISKTFSEIHFWILEEMTGVKSRFFVWECEYASTLAIEAWKKCINKSGVSKGEIDLLIFASASQDIIEPATWNIVQKWLWLSCPVFDVKNACNSFLNAIDIADSFIISNKYKNIIICSWETPSKVIKYDVKNRNEFKWYFAWYTLWDAGSAMILSKSERSNWIKSSFFYSDWSTWDLATIMWWWSRYPHDVEKNYFFWDPWKIRDKFMSIWSWEFDKWLLKLWWEKKRYKKSICSSSSN